MAVGFSSRYTLVSLALPPGTDVLQVESGGKLSRGIEDQKLVSKLGGAKMEQLMESSTRVASNGGNRD